MNAHIGKRAYFCQRKEWNIMKPKYLSWIFTLAVITVCLCLLPTKAQAASESDLTFKLNTDGESYSVSDCNFLASGKLVIPATYNGKPVTAIGYEAFRGCSQMTSISIPSTVSRIEQGAFWDCTGLTSVVIPKRVTELSIQLFEGCTSLTTLTLPKNLKVIRIEALYNTRLMNIYFAGTEAQWAAVTVEEANHELDFATVHYEYKE